MIPVTGSTPSESGSGPEVRTAAGVLRGSREAGVAVFRGIPYAEPPVGALRFAAPRPVRGWAGVRAAVSYGPPPPQPARSAWTRWAGAAGDDWLTVNVWSPDPARAPACRCMVWIHGGGYVIGTSGLPEYDGGRLAGRRRRRGDVQLPARGRGFRADRGRPGQPRAARPGRRAGVGARQHPGLRRRPGPGDGLRRVGGRRVGRRAAGHAAGGRAVPPGHRAERAGHVLLAGARRRHRRRLRRRTGAAAHGGRPVRR